MKQKMKNFALAAMALTISVTTFSKEGEPSGKVEKMPGTVVLEWNEAAYKAFGGPAYQHSLMASRINAMVHIAMFDALNAIQPKYKPYAYTGKDPRADAVAAAASAAHAVLLHEIPEKKEFLDSALQRSLSGVINGDAKKRGVKLGDAAAQAILYVRANDGSAGNPIAQIPVSNVPGVYQAVPPFDFVFAPYWENVKLFGLKHKAQFRSASQPGLSSAAYTAGFNEVKEKGKMNSTSRTADETEYAKFWYEFSEAGWNRVTRTVVINEKLNLLDAARLFALVDMALADAYIAGWDSKFNYGFWRPYTAIRTAATDGNDATTPDADWESSEPTPPVHDYPSTHSALGNAAAAVLAGILGDNTPFSMTSPTALHATKLRSFNSFSQAANENAASRVMAGIHFRFSCVAGQELGNRIGNWVVENHLQPLN